MSQHAIDEEILEEIGVSGGQKPEKLDYHAFGIDRANPDKKQQGLLIYYDENTMGHMDYSFLKGSLLSTEKNKPSRLALLFTGPPLTLIGRHFTEMHVVKFKEHQISAIRVFDERRFNPPPPGEPVILSITQEQPETKGGA